MKEKFLVKESYSWNRHRKGEIEPNHEEALRTGGGGETKKNFSVEKPFKKFPGNFPPFEGEATYSLGRRKKGEVEKKVPAK